jgi:hypothetical protein
MNSYSPSSRLQSIDAQIVVLRAKLNKIFTTVCLLVACLVALLILTSILSSSRQPISVDLVLHKASAVVVSWFYGYLFGLPIACVVEKLCFRADIKSLRSLEELALDLRNKEEKSWRVSNEALRAESEARNKADRERAKAERKQLRMIKAQHDRQLLRMDKLDPFDFEKMVAERYEQLGYAVRLTPKSGDFGVDIWIDKEGKRGAVQCKRYAKANKVGRPEIQAFAGAIHSEEASYGVFITTGYFSDNARQTIRKLNSKIFIETMDREQVFNFLNESS